MMTTAVVPAGIVRGPEGLPAHTLGWQVLGWTADYLEQPDGPDAGSPWRFTPEQARFLLWFYALTDEAKPRFVYRYAMLRRMKGWGKDPFAAALAAVEMIGPCRFGHWTPEGEPVAIPHPAGWVQIAAVSQEQTRNTMTLFPGLFSKAAIAEYNIDLGKTIIYALGGRARIEAVTRSPRALEGGRPTLVVKNETHHWIAANAGQEMSDVIARNLAKSRDGDARALAISNAHAPGERSDAEADWEAHQKGAPDVLYSSVEAREDVELVPRGTGPEGAVTDEDRARSDAAVLAALDFCRGDSRWLDIRRLLAEIRDPRTSANMSRRFYGNLLAAGDDRAFDIDQWPRLAKPRQIGPSELITLGFDGSTNRDHTALIATHVATGYQWTAGYWEPEELPDGELRIDVEAVKATVEDVFERYDVWRMYADPFRWKEELVAWAGRYNKPGKDVVAEFNTTRTRAMAYALAHYRAAQDAGDLTHDGDPRYAACIRQAFRHVEQFRDDQGEPMWTIQKERPDSPLKIDAAIAGCLSWLARLDAIAAGVLEQRNDVVLWVPAPKPKENG